MRFEPEIQSEIQDKLLIKEKGFFWLPQSKRQGKMVNGFKPFNQIVQRNTDLVSKEGLSLPVVD